MRKIILDTDMGSDCDDAGALSVLHRLADENKVEILAVTYCSTEIHGAVALKAINSWFGRGDILIGRMDKGTFLEDEPFKRFTKPIAEKYLKKNEKPVFENVVRVMRRTLSENRDVVLVAIGMLNNISALLKSQPDDISDLTGAELIEKSVLEMYVMGGNFRNLNEAEYNIAQAVSDAQYVSENFPKPIVYCGFEIGEKVITGANLEKADDDNPIRFAYYISYEGDIKEKPLRNSWDPITVYCAVENNTPYYKKSDKMKISFDDKGRVVLGGKGKDSYLISQVKSSDMEIVIDKYIY